MKNVLVWIGGRANYGRLKMLLRAIQDDEDLNLYIITGSYDIPDGEFKSFGNVDNLLERDTYRNRSKSIALVITGVTDLISVMPKIDVAVVHGDRFENLGFAIACSYANIQLLHIEGGDVSGQIDDKVRDAITMLADWHCAVSRESYYRLVYRKVDNSRERVVLTGSPAIDFVKTLPDRVNYYFNHVLVLFNPSDNDDFLEFVSAIRYIAAKKTVIWVSPNNDPGHKKINEPYNLVNIVFVKNLTPEEFYEYLAKSICLIGNTSSGIKEAAFLGVPYILVGTRQEGREVGNNVTRCDCEASAIWNAYANLDTIRYEPDLRFGDGNAVERIIKVIKGVS